VATTEESDIPDVRNRIAQVRDLAGNAWEEVWEVERATSQTIHGRAGQPLWPVALLLCILTAFTVGGALASVIGALATALLLVFTISRR